MIISIALLTLCQISAHQSFVSTKPAQTQEVQMLPETPAEKAKRMQWWKDDRFGMFIHWGLYAVPAGTWKGPGGKPGTDYAEWIRENAQIPVNVYDKFEQEFDPVKFNALDWVKMAKNAGMRYIVITSKHHDGFNMFASKYTNFNIMNTPWHHDPMKDLAKACKDEGLTFCFYHSIMDWHDPDYLPRRSWEVKNRPVDGADFNRFVKYLHNDVKQLLTDYGPIGVMWFDGNWESTWNDKLGTELYNLCRTVQPNVIVNNRVGASGNVGDYFTPEQHIPDTGYGPGKYWETCMTMNDHWGYNKDDHDYKSVNTIIHNLVDIVSKGGNYLLNVGPTAQGTFPPQAIQLLSQIGDWMHVNSESIYDTDASVFKDLPWGRSTTKQEGDKTQLYLDVEKWPENGILTVPGIGNEPIEAHVLGTNTSLEIKRDGPNLNISVPDEMPNKICTVIKLTIQGTPVIYNSPTIDADTTDFVGFAYVPITIPNGLTVHYTTDGTTPTTLSPIYRDQFVISGNQDVTVKAAGFFDSKMVTPVVEQTFHAAKPWDAVKDWQTAPGLDRAELKGNFTSVSQFPASPGGDLQNMVSSKIVDQVQLPASWGDKPKEQVGLVFSGGINAPKTGEYSFRLTSDDGSRLIIDGNTVVDNDGLHGTKSIVGAAPLSAGIHTFTLDYFNGTGAADLKLEWKTEGSDWTEVPASALIHPSLGN